MKNDGQFAVDEQKLWLIAVAVIPISSLAGLAARLRTDDNITRLEIVSAMLNSGLFGFVVFCLGAHYWGTQSLWLLVGISVLSGLGGNSAIDLLREVARKKLFLSAGINDNEKDQ